MNNAFIDYLKYLGANSDEAELTLWNIRNRIADGESTISILNSLDLPLDLIDLL
jgi:hypothetical protein